MATKQGLSRDEIIALGDHPEYHIPVFGGLGKTLCGIFSYTYGKTTGKPLCKKCEQVRKESKNGHTK